MKKIIYLNELEVNLGDYIEIGEIIVIVTQELIDSNLNKFKITEKVPEYVKCIKLTRVNSPNGQTAFIEATKEEYDKQELLKEARLKYPIGTIINSLGGCNNYECLQPKECHQIKWSNDYQICGYGVTLYDSNPSPRWAEIIPQKKPLFKDSLGNWVYRGDKLTLVYSDLSKLELIIDSWTPSC